MKKQELVKLIERAENLQRVSEKFGDDTAKAAVWVARRMRDAGISVLDYGPGRIHLRDSRTNVGPYEVLTITDPDCCREPESDYCYAPPESGDLLDSCIAANDSYYCHGDFSHQITVKNREEAVTFARRLPLIVQALADLVNVPEVPALPTRQ